MKFDHEESHFNWGECTKCNCHNFLRRDSPTKSDKVFAVVMMGMIITLIGSIPYLYYEISQFENLDMVIETNEDGEVDTVGDLTDMIILTYSACVLLYAVFFGSVIILPIFNKRKVRD